MNLKSYLFYDQTDDTETEVVCESIDTALLMFCQLFDVIFVIENIEEGEFTDFGFPKVYITGVSESCKG